MAPAVFNTDVAEYLGQAGSIPVRLRRTAVSTMSILPAPGTAPTGVPATAGAVRAGERTAAEYACALLDRAGGAAGLLAVDAESLRAAAAALDRRTDRFALPLAGVLVAVEEGISTTGRGDEPVRRLRGAGALVAGRARTAEFGIGPDGSPGGRATAAAVATGTVPLGIGVDGDGALRAAAAAHGLAALKPGRRVLPLPPGADRRWAGLAETTVVAAGPADLRAALDVLAAPARRAPAVTGGLPGATALGPAPAPAAAPAADGGEPVGSLACSLRTGRTRLADPAAAAAVHAAIRVLGTTAVRLLAADPPYRAVLPVHGARRRHAGLARRVEDLDLDPAGLPRTARSALRRGRRVRRLGGLRPATPASWRQRLVGWLDDAGAEAGLLPVTSGPTGAGTTGLAAWNLAGLPSLVAPVPTAGGPACVQLVGRPGSERRLLATAELLGGS
ncbi:putative amidase [Pseudonocardia sp. Ae356_Ps1]|nr:putative amidase [Pseudonocardia sp. Ae150A_Ps1]OLL90232.1 putative amidase [Pseudonocardia sp. Ae356_Ps1]OLM16919.1 putative amidase [Pseudonocardia sp. Ae707_Ps1]